MKTFDNQGVTQKCMSQFIGVVPSTISRHMSSRKIEPLPSTTGTKNQRYSIPDCRKVMIDLFRKHLHVKNKIHCFYNFKGGTGKTSICYQVSSQLALLGFKVLVIDADPQAHLTSSFGLNNSNNHMTLFDIIAENTPLNEVIQPVYEGLDCIPSNISLTRLEVLLNQMPKREERIKISLSSIEPNYDFIIFDTNPTISYLNRNIISYSQLINIICETQPYSLQGLKILMEDMEKFFFSMQIKHPQVIITPNKYEDRTATSAEAMTVLRSYYAEYMKVDFAIRKSEDINTSAKNCLPLPFFAKSNSIALADVTELIMYIIKKSCEIDENLRKDIVMSVA